MCDIRPTSYDALTANPDGYQGTIEDALAQIRAEHDIPPKPITARQELLQFLGVTKPKSKLSGIQEPAPHYPSVYIFPLNDNEDWSVNLPDDEPGSPMAREMAHWDLDQLPRNCS